MVRIARGVMSTMFIKVNSIRIKRESSGSGYVHVASTITMCLFIAIFMFVLATFINGRFKKIVVPEDLYFPQLTSTFAKIQTSSNSSLLYLSQYRSPSVFPVLSPNTSTVTVGMFKDSTRLWHSMSDEELMQKALKVSRVLKYPRKVAFMFLTRGSLPLRPLWERFFQGHEALFSIYLHTSPEYCHEPPNSSVFYKRRIPSKQVEWGKATMIDAERRLLANALLDSSNQRFVLLSETCIPVFNFTTVYNYLTYSNQSFLNSFDDPSRIGRGRYNKRMAPTVTLSDWRKGSQWFEISRELANEIISDKTYYPVFRNHCWPPCYMDEHYLPTLVNKLCPDSTTDRTVTWTDWSSGGSHPAMFRRKDITEAFLGRIRYGSNCSYNGETSSICYLFGRKFHPSSLQPLLKLGPRLLGF